VAQNRIKPRTQDELRKLLRQSSDDSWCRRHIFAQVSYHQSAPKPRSKIFLNRFENAVDTASEQWL